MKRLFSVRGACQIPILLACAAVLWPAAQASGQGVTTSSIAGVVRDAQGLAIPGATIVAVHEPSGTKYETISLADGRYTIPGMRVGGPYSITASLEGFQSKTTQNVFLRLPKASP
jgi:hypothetical protein